MAKEGKAKKTGIKMADAIIDFCHLMYQKDTVVRVLNALIRQLQRRREEFRR